MGLSQRVTELLERWLGNGEVLTQSSPYVTLGNVTDSAGITDSALNVNQFLNFDTILGATLNPKITGPFGFTAHGISTTTENFITPLRTNINLSNIYYPTTAQKLYLASTSAQDNATGTGASLVGIAGLDANHEEIFDIVQLNGQTGVESNLYFIRANAIYVLDFGSGSVLANGERLPAGNIYLAGTNNFTLGVPTNPMLGIDGTNADTFLQDLANREALYTVPSNKILLIKDYTMNTELSKAARVSIHVRLFGEDFFRMVSPQTLQEGINKLSFDSVFAIPPRTDLQMRTKNNVGTSNAFVAVNFIGALYDVS